MAHPRAGRGQAGGGAGDSPSPSVVQKGSCRDAAPPTAFRKGSLMRAGHAAPWAISAGCWPFSWSSLQEGQLCREDLLASIVCCWGCYGDASWVETQGGGPYLSLRGLTSPSGPGCLSGEAGGE